MKDLLKKYKEEAVELRRRFHAHPEPSLSEHWTTDQIEEDLKKLGIETHRITPTGLVAYIRGKEGGKTIALRADIDALELQELSTHDYASKEKGLMHACGHDAHAAGLLYAARILNDKKDEFTGQVKLIFQPAEEVALGAKQMIDAGALDDVDAIFGIHVWNDLEVGTINLEKGPRMASASHFKVKITGKGGHGALPNQGVDALVCASAMVMNLQTIVSREIHPLEPAVVTVGMLRSGTRFNILAEEAYFEGTARCFNDDVNKHIEEAVKRIAEDTAKSYRATAEVDYQTLIVPTINDDKMAEIGRRAAVKLFGEEVLVPQEPNTGGEDFSYYCQKVPGAFAFVGTSNPKKLDMHPHHHPKFDIDEDGLTYSAGLYAQVALEYLSE